MQLRMNLQHWQRHVAPILLASLLAACGSAPKAPSAAAGPAARTTLATSTAAGNKDAAHPAPALPPAGSGRGGYYQDDGPGDKPPEGLADTPDAEPKIEPYSAKGNRPYVVFGKTYTPITDGRPFRQRGVGSWYGKKFHGQKTSSGEPYDMYKMTAAHPTLPIPSYARVTNLGNGRQVIVRVNDRGPFHSDRIIDLSYTAALKLGYLGAGSSQLEVERLLPDEIDRIASSRQKPLEPRQAVAPGADAMPREASVAGIPVAAETAGTASAMAPAAPGAADTQPATVTAGGFYLQLGAYSRADNAQAVRAQLSRKWANSLPPIEVVEYGVFYRLYSGPFATRDDAANAAKLVQDSGMSRPPIVQRY